MIVAAVVRLGSYDFYTLAVVVFAVAVTVVMSVVVVAVVVLVVVSSP